MVDIDYELDEHIAILTMKNGENRFNFDFFEAIHKVLDEIEKNNEAKILVVRSAHEKIWCNGIDLDWFLPLSKSDPKEFKRFPFELTGFLKRILYFPMVTIAAINGHAFAGGAMMAAAMDFRFMRKDRGYLCIPEVDLGIPLFPSMIAIMQKAVPQYKFLEMQYLGTRMTADECEKHNIITRSCHKNELMDNVLNFARLHKKDPRMIGAMKELTYKHFEKIFEVDDHEWKG
ncbi:MAG: enoyl-CoA hydratase/isomerase family protein [Desulfobacteraceae bacterium]|nr:enoyl-CoA hydratase/isomerase family protein [Desulfobacteraceae bacterium]